MTRAGWGTVAQVVLGGLLLGAVLLAVSAVYAPGPPVAVCLAAGVCLAGAARLLGSTPPEQPEIEAGTPRWEPPGRPGLTDVGALEAVLRAADGDQDRFDQRIRPLLAEVTVDLLRQRCGLVWGPDETIRAVARERLGPHLWELLTTPEGGVPAGRSPVRTWIAEMERL